MGNYDWLLTMRAQLMEGYAAPLFPTIDYNAEHAAELIARSGSNLFRFPALGYCSASPTITSRRIRNMKISYIS